MDAAVEPDKYSPRISRNFSSHSLKALELIWLPLIVIGLLREKRKEIGFRQFKLLEMDFFLFQFNSVDIFLPYYYCIDQTNPPSFSFLFYFTVALHQQFPHPYNQHRGEATDYTLLCAEN